MYKNGFHKSTISIADALLIVLRDSALGKQALGLTLAFTDAGLAITEWFGPC